MMHTTPDSDLARGAAIYARAVEDEYLVNHSSRTFHFGAAILDDAGRSFDAEILYVAAMLHDIALGTSLDDGVTPFHQRGAGLAAGEVLRLGRTDAEATLVYDAVNLHMELVTGDHALPEVAGVHLGAGADVVGLRLDQIPPAVVDAVLADHPRLGMKAEFAKVIVAEATTKPYSTAAALIRDLNFLDLMAAAPFAE
jgi:hypothetical protein